MPSPPPPPSPQLCIAELRAMHSAKEGQASWNEQDEKGEEDGGGVG